MPFEIPSTTPLAYFCALVKDDAGLPLLEAAISIAQDEYPELDVQDVLGEVDVLLDRVKKRCPSDADAITRLRVLNRFFFIDLGFGGNVNNYQDPDNSFVHVLLTTRRGIPISLAVLWLELAQGLGLKARGINFPGHFLVKVHLPQGQVVMDPLTGESLSKEEISQRLLAQEGDGLFDDFELRVALHLQASTRRDMLARMLRNLKHVYLGQGDWLRQIAVLDRLLILLPEDWLAYRDRGLAWAEMGDARLAMTDLEVYLAQVERATDRNAITRRMQELRRALS